MIAARSDGIKESSRSRAYSAGQHNEDPRAELEEFGERKYEKCRLKVTARDANKQVASKTYRRQVKEMPIPLNIVIHICCSLLHAGRQHCP